MAAKDNHLLPVAIEAAKKAGEYLLGNLNKIKPDEINEKAENDFVTYVDTASEKLIIEHIINHFPNHAILSEEDGNSRYGNEFQWIVDPLDGTSNYIQGITIFCVSIAVKKNNRIIVGVVFDPVHNELFSSELGKGAKLNDKPIQLNEKLGIRRAMIATGFPHRKKRFLPLYLPAFQEIMLKCSGMRRCGSAALDLCYTACGRYAGFWELGLSPWDTAAGSLIVAEAGGIVSDFWGDSNYLENGFLIAAADSIHAELQNILSYHFKQFKT